MNNIVFLSIGTNKGDKIFNCKSAIKKISVICEILQISSIYKTDSWGFKDEVFLNFAVKINTRFPADKLLRELQDIEKEMGRVKSSNYYQGRIIDIDILFFGNKIINQKTLIVPHPKLYQRKFVLLPLYEISSDLICPMTRKKINSLLKECNDSLSVEKFSEF